MLGEDHSLLNEFPQYKETIRALAKMDENFLAAMKSYDSLDKEIRKLEMMDSPVSDEEMHKMKHDQAVMKDQLHKRLISAHR
ncbi:MULTISPECIES: YdcH family protein [Vibrio]|uniref:YdcH family protein n=1 Tax=Vibrio TaxID=662 RepID=UPI00207593FD|nr:MULTISPECIES: DUF465 domain-containing protein [Vibrio]USD34636.1 DUF465 domain-containing protein [Vibrio sp. SCSIO 43186]USD47703.1 DUF465 domain-containing protein [Vibrio sp. SCSIO 43145]USD71761.1 DUF465 domain-containing protein [Vibrio sp. SCSIO 43139]USD98664.1 hypothetical protein CTT30_21900 [Vibrio coralliilyticus]